MQKTNKLVIVGDGPFAEIAYEYFSAESEFEVVAFAVEKEYIKRDSLMGLPVVPFEEVQERYAPAEHHVFAAITYNQLNRLRTRLAKQAKEKGYALASFISPHAFVWKNVELGEHCFIFENNVVQPFVKLGNNVVLWSGNHIGHHSTIKDNCFIASHVVISGFVEVAENGFLGVNATVTNNVKIAGDNWIGAGVCISKDTEPGALYPSGNAEPSKISAPRFFKVKS
jgi:sugar O-acyltransferase (sialic acid O-acetyltransferase NeuD family)